MNAANAPPSTLDELAALFAPASREDWLRLVERTLKGGSFESLTRRTLEGVAIEPLYSGVGDRRAPARQAPGWDVRTPVAARDPAAANAEALDNLAQGADSVLLRLGGTVRGGIETDGPAAFERVLEGVVLEAATAALDAGFAGVWAAERLADSAKGSPAARLAFHIDPLGAFAETGAAPEPLAALVGEAAALAARLADTYPSAAFFLASGVKVHEAGGGEAAELAAAVASALVYIRAMEAAGLARETALGRIALGLAVDADVFLSIAKLRAARRLWAKIAAACGVAAPARLEVRSSARMLTRADPWTNMVRLTAAGFAAAAGGADAIVLGAFSDAVGPPSAFARRQSRNIQLILKEETGLGRVSDPAAGSGYVEDLTDALARRTWERLQEIERAGGMAAALETGLVRRFADEGRAELAARIARREVKVLGVTDHRPADGEPPLALGEDPPAGEVAPVDPERALIPFSLEALA